jgi:hypothetical protein
LVEGSNIPLGLLAIFNVVPSLKTSVIFTVNGVMLWVSYLLLRVPIPVAMYYLGLDLYLNGADKGGICWVFADSTWQQAWVVYLFVSGSFLWLLSMWWFKKLPETKR